MTADAHLEHPHPDTLRDTTHILGPTLTHRKTHSDPHAGKAHELSHAPNSHTPFLVHTLKLMSNQTHQDILKYYHSMCRHMERHCFTHWLPL